MGAAACSPAIAPSLSYAAANYYFFQTYHNHGQEGCMASASIFKSRLLEHGPWASLSALQWLAHLSANDCVLD
jgi:hypothetical protein